MASSNFLLNAVKGPLKDTIERARLGAPTAIDKALASAASAVAGSTAKATSSFANVYADVSKRTAAWLPTTRAQLAVAADKAAVWAKAQVEKL